MRVIILLILFAAAMAAPERGQRIMGGEPTTVDRHPYIASMEFLGIFWQQWCVGTLITSSTILSAARCYILDNPRDWRARLGSSFYSSGGSVYQVARIINHEEYSLHNFYNNDVAILHLATPAVLSATVRPIAIAGSNYNVPDGTVVAITGWGELYIGGPNSEQLQTVNVNTINQELCAERYAHLNILGITPDVDDTIMCTGILNVGGKGFCTGDYGGPVVHDGRVVIGVMSWVWTCADPHYPGVNTRVSSFVDWIVANSI